jgi:hypothetical protein
MIHITNKKGASMKSIKKIVSSTVATATLVVLQAPIALAQVPVQRQLPTNVPSGFANIGELINTVFKVIISAAGVIFLILFLVGGVQYLTAAGNEEATGKARRLLVDSIVGLIIILAAWAVGTWILGALGLTADSSTINTF